MPYVTSIERSARRAGLREGIEVLPKVRFGQQGLTLMPLVCEVHEEDQLRTILNALESAPGLDDVRPLCAPTLD